MIETNTASGAKPIVIQILIKASCWLVGKIVFWRVKKYVARNINRLKVPYIGLHLRDFMLPPRSRREMNCPLLGYYTVNCANPLSKFRDNISVHTSWPLKIGPIDCPKTLVRNYHYTLRNSAAVLFGLHLIVVNNALLKPESCDVSSLTYWGTFQNSKVFATKDIVFASHCKEK
jgi:hypothetical protein